MDPWGEYNRECTSFVAWALASRNGFTMPFYDNANNWGPRARALGYTVDQNPTPGSVAWSALGHVAYVQDVSGAGVHIEEYNHYEDGTYSSRTVPAATFTGYIHFQDRAGGGPGSGGGTGPQTLSISTPVGVVAAHGFNEFQPLTFSYSVVNTSGAGASIQRFSVPVRDPEGSPQDIQCENGANVTLAAGQTFTCTATIGTGYGEAGTYTYWADWLGYDNKWHEGQLGGHKQFTLAP